MKGKLMGAAIYPHPPIIIKEIGRGKERLAQNTIMGVAEVSARIKQLRPELLIVISPHGSVFHDAISIHGDERLSGDFGIFGHEELEYTYQNHLPFVKELLTKTKDAGINTVKITVELAHQYHLDKSAFNDELDHGVLVPLYFLSKGYREFRIVSITYGLLSSEKLDSFGRCLRETAEEMGIHAVIIASGDLSHCLLETGAYEYMEAGKTFDAEMVRLVKKGDMEGILHFNPELSEQAMECGLRSFQVMAGAMKDFELDSQVYSYEGPFGVGYMTAFIENMGEKPQSQDREAEDLYVKLARESLEYYVSTGQMMPTPKDLAKEMLHEKAACFVSIKKQGELRGCIGTIYPSKENMAREIIENAVSAGMYDPRFHKVSSDELEALVYSVDVLKKPQRISSIEELDPEKYGIIVSVDKRKGLLLPNLEGVDTIEQQLNIALRKGNIDVAENYIIEKFEVERHQ